MIRFFPERQATNDERPSIDTSAPTIAADASSLTDRSSSALPVGPDFADADAEAEAHHVGRGPLRVMFVVTSMPVGGMETLLVELIRRLDRRRFAPELCCLKYLDVLGEELAREIPVHTSLLSGKYDLRVLYRLPLLMRQRRIDAVVTVGTGGDKMFWGRLAARLAGVPVICSALHSTGLPDRVERLNRLLVPITDAFIGVAHAHGRYLAEHEGCPAHKVRVIPNGVDVARFRPRQGDAGLRRSLGLPEHCPVVGIVAALRPEKNHEMFLEVARRVRNAHSDVRFLIVGDGRRRNELEAMAVELLPADAVKFLGSRPDVPELLSLFDVFLLTSHMEANPVSILEAMACGKPVVAPRVGSIPETIAHGQTGLLFEPGDSAAAAELVLGLLAEPTGRERIGTAARRWVVAHGSVESMVKGYEKLIREIYFGKRPTAAGPSPSAIE